MRWKVGGVNFASGGLDVVGYTPNVCQNDNGTDVCSAGHKLKSPGVCLSQSIGTVFSTDDLFQPEYPVCTSDYVGFFGSTGYVLKSSTDVGADFNLTSLGGEDSSTSVVLRAYSLSYSEYLVRKDIYADGSFSFYCWEDYISTVLGEYYNDLYVVGVHDIIQIDSGYIVHLDEASSDYFQLDISSSVFIVHPFYYSQRLSKQLKVASVEEVTGWFEELADSTKGRTTNPSSAEEENPVEICVGDITPPVLQNVTPASGTLLVPAGTNVTFDIADNVGGVYKPSVYITVSGATTSQPGGINVVSAGVPNAYASFDGVPARYSLCYNQPVDWQENEVVTINARGTDIVPTISGVPFSCTGGEPNSFDYTWWFKISNASSLYADITAIADSSPPYLDSVVPAMYSAGNNAETVISFHIKDDHAGVDLSTLFIYINGSVVVAYGESIAIGAYLSGSQRDYIFSFSSPSSYPYGDQITVRVVVDDLYAASPNTLDITYYFEIVDSDTLRIENFYPSVGITWNPEQIDIGVDVIDEVYDVDESDLYLSINNTLCPAAITPIYGVSGTIGRHLEYHPPNDFAYDGAINVLVHGTNLNAYAPVTVEHVYQLFHGYNVKVFDKEFNYNKRVNVFIKAGNTVRFSNFVNYGFYFDTIVEPTKDISASIVGIAPWVDLGAEILPQAPVHKYGKTMEVIIYVEDFDGNALGPYTFYYTIEQAPE